MQYRCFGVYQRQRYRIVDLHLFLKYNMSSTKDLTTSFTWQGRSELLLIPEFYSQRTIGLLLGLPCWWTEFELLNMDLWRYFLLVLFRLILIISWRLWSFVWALISNAFLYNRQHNLGWILSACSFNCFYILDSGSNASSK